MQNDSPSVAPSSHNPVCHPFHHAFPIPGFSSKGLTKREYFAGLALQGMLAATDDFESFTAMAHTAVILADALVSELNRGLENQ